MKKMTVLAVGLLLLVPALAFSDSLSIRVGYFMPRGVTSSALNIHPDSLWTIELDQMSFLPRDYNASILGLSYDYFVGKYVNLSLGVDSYNRSKYGYYLDWVANTIDQVDYAFPFADFLGNDIFHSFRVSITPLQASLKVLPMGRRGRIVPYVGGGASVVFWNIHMFGDTVDFSAPFIYTDPDLGDVTVYAVTPIASEESGVSFGWHAMGGIQVPIGYRATIDAEAKYLSARANLRELFSGFEPFDLSGWSFSLGLSYWF